MIILVVLPVGHSGDESPLLVGDVVDHADRLVVGLQQTVRALYFVTVADLMLALEILGLVVGYVVVVVILRMGLKTPLSYKKNAANHSLLDGSLLRGAHPREC